MNTEESKEKMIEGGECSEKKTRMAPPPLLCCRDSSVGERIEKECGGVYGCLQLESAYKSIAYFM